VILLDAHTWLWRTADETGRRLVTRDRFLRRYDPDRAVW
jgi:hypothetical protein